MLSFKSAKFRLVYSLVIKYISNKQLVILYVNEFTELSINRCFIIKPYVLCVGCNKSATRVHVQALYWSGRECSYPSRDSRLHWWRPSQCTFPKIAVSRHKYLIYCLLTVTSTTIVLDCIIIFICCIANKTCFLNLYNLL